MRVGINGFGRIGRACLRAWLEGGRDDVEVVAVNSRSECAVAAHLLQYDSVHGRLGVEVCAEESHLAVGGRRLRYSRQLSPETINWRAVGAEVVLECAGVFNSREAAAGHLQGGARRVLISAPAKNADATVVFGVNHHLLEGDWTIASAASCTTNCVAPLAKILHSQFGIECGWMSTVHAMTADQRLLDESHNDLRRARAAGASIIPTKTGAAEAVAVVLPELAGKLAGGALRVPVHNVSLAELTCRLSAPADVDSINAAFCAAAAEMPPNVLAVNNAPLVSSDFNHRPESAIVDLTQTRIIGDLAKVSAWYDNEWGFACRMLDLAAAAK